MSRGFLVPIGASALAGGRRRGLCLRLRVDRAHHLHVDARVSGACGEPVRPTDLPLRLSGQHPGWVLGLRDRAYGLRLVLHLDLAHRHPGRVVGGFLAQAGAGRRFQIEPLATKPIYAN